ncbi:restriction endonuclease subunit S [Gordonia hongkongensis]|nr:restriction endonuclease subunit S [Gordonia hongkongensis]
MPTTDSGPVMVTAKDIRGGRIDYNTARHTSIDAFRKNLTDKSRPQLGDILLTKDGSIGRVAVCDRDDICINQSVALLQLKAGVNPKFLAYLLQAPEYQAAMAADADGSTIKHIYITRVDKMSIRVPDLVAQVAIAEVLGALDDKIAANERATTTAQHYLRTVASRLISSSNSAIALNQCAEIVKGVSYRSADLQESKTALVTLKSVSREGNFEFAGFKEFVGKFTPAQQVVAGDIIVAQTDLTQGGDVIGRAVRVPPVDSYDRLVASLDLAIVRPRDCMTSEYLLACLQQRNFHVHCASFASGTTVLHLSRGAFESYEVPFADSESQARYAALARDVHQLIDAIGQESRRLTSTRDQLLPLLMSGKVTVKDIEPDIEDIV